MYNNLAIFLAFVELESKTLTSSRLMVLLRSLGLFPFSSKNESKTWDIKSNIFFQRELNIQFAKIWLINLLVYSIAYLLNLRTAIVYTTLSGFPTLKSVINYKNKSAYSIVNLLNVRSKNYYCIYDSIWISYVEICNKLSKKNLSTPLPIYLI